MQTKGEYVKKGKMEQEECKDCETVERQILQNFGVDSGMSTDNFELSFPNYGPQNCS